MKGLLQFRRSNGADQQQDWDEDDDDDVDDEVAETENCDAFVDKVCKACNQKEPA